MTALKNADSMLVSLMQAVDRNNDGVIQYDGTRSNSVCVEQAKKLPRRERWP